MPRLCWAITLLYVGLIGWLSSHSRPPIPDAVTVLDDKVLHFLEFAALGFLTLHALLASWPHRSTAQHLLWAVALGLCVAFLDELLQAFVPARQSDWRDAVADGLGALCGATLRWGLGSLIRRAKDLKEA